MKISRLKQAMWRTALFGFVLLYLGNGGRAFADSNALWNIVNGQCVPHEIAGHAPAPCSAVSLDGGYAVLKDRRGKYQYLLIPTRRVTGIEDPYLETTAAPNYFADAWTERAWLEKQLGVTVPRQDVALAINSFYGRSQNQLHIHIDCIRPDVAAALAAHAAHFGGDWTPLALPPSNHVYLVRQIDAAELSGINPFALIAAQRPSQNMAQETAVVVAAELSDGRPGFYLLSSRADLPKHDYGSGEELQDETCGIVKRQ
jgi:CDP-diacylglycerol pyrophosphatase